MPRPLKPLPEREVSTPDGERWTVRTIRAGIPDPARSLWTGPVFQVRRLVAAIRYRRAHRTDWRVLLHPGIERYGGVYDEPVLDETYPTPEAAEQRAEALVQIVRSGLVDEILEGRDPEPPLW